MGNIAERLKRFGCLLLCLAVLFPLVPVRAAAAQDGETVWMCRSCGYLHCGKEAPKVCPVCSRGQGFMIRENFEPFTPGK